MNINPVFNNNDKQRTYKEYCGKYRKAVVEEFYFEALMITYSMFEDRARSFLYHIGAYANRNDEKICKKVRSSLMQIVKDNHSENENDKLNITKISSKLKLIRCTLLWALNTDGGYESDIYLSALKSQYEGAFDIEDFLITIAEIESWCQYRNEIIHALLNKNVESIKDDLASKTENGMRLARKIDGYVKAVKKNNKIRRAIKLPVNK